MPDYHAISIKESYEFICTNDLIHSSLKYNIKRFSWMIEGKENEFNSPIFPIRFDNTEILEKAILDLTNNGFLSYVIKPPTVPLNKDMIRICIHSFNSKQEIDLLCDILNFYGKK